MPLDRGTDPKARKAADLAYQSLSLVTKGFSYIGNANAIPTAPWFTTDQTYFVSAVSWDMTLSDLTTTFGSLTVALRQFGQGFTTVSSYDIMDQAISMIGGNIVILGTGSASFPSSKFENYGPYGLYLPKGSRLSFATILTGTIAYVALNVTVYLMPTYQ